MSKQYRHLSVEDRAMVHVESRKSESLRSMARTLGRPPSTISREFKRNQASAGTGGSCTSTSVYDATVSSDAYRVRRRRSGRKPR